MPPASRLMRVRRVQKNLFLPVSIEEYKISWSIFFQQTGTFPTLKYHPKFSEKARKGGLLLPPPLPRKGSKCRLPEISAPIGGKRTKFGWWLGRWGPLLCVNFMTICQYLPNQMRSNLTDEGFAPLILGYH